MRTVAPFKARDSIESSSASRLRMVGKQEVIRFFLDSPPSAHLRQPRAEPRGILVHRRTYTELLWEVNASHHRYKIGEAVARFPCNNVPRSFYFLQRGSGIGGPTRTEGTSRKGIATNMEADRLKRPARKRFSSEISFALNERAMRRGRFPCS
jgi:hypothetical protein